MRILLTVTSFALLAWHTTAGAEPIRACAQVGALLDGAVRPLLAHLAEADPNGTQLPSQFRACFGSRNICSVSYDARDGKEQLIAADVTADLPAQYLSGNGSSVVILLVRSIPRVRTDSNQYCLVSEKHGGATSSQQWDVYGWVIAPRARQPLPLKREPLNYGVASRPGSVRGLAAALWFFAERMSGRPVSAEEGMF